MFSNKHVFNAFKVLHTPGIARALVRTLESGKQIVVTDIGGYDLPPIEGPMKVILLGKNDELLEGPMEFAEPHSFWRWLEKLASGEQASRDQQ